MQQILLMVEYLLWKYGRDALEDGERVLDFTQRFVVPNNGLPLELIRYLYDSGIIASLVEVAPEKRAETLARISYLLHQRFPNMIEYTDNCLAIFAKSLGYSLETLEPYYSSYSTDLKDRLSKFGEETEEEMLALEDYYLGNYYFLSNDLPTAMAYWEKAAQSGNASAMVTLIEWLAKAGLTEQLEYWYNKLLETEDELAIVNIGILFLVDKNYEKAEEALRKMADKGNLDAMSFLGEVYRTGYSDPQKYREWLIKAANAGFPTAQIILGHEASDQGNYEGAVEWYIKAVRPSEFEFMDDIARIYEEDLNDLDNAEKWYLKAASVGDPKLIFSLANFYNSARKDYDKAKKYYLKAALGGEANAMAELGNLYETIFHDDRKAEKCYRKSVAGKSWEGERLYKNFLEKKKGKQKRSS